MLTPTDIATFDKRYRRYRAELRHATNLDPVAVAQWIGARSKLLVLRFLATDEAKRSNMIDYQAWLREQYARDQGLFR